MSKPTKQDSALDGVVNPQGLLMGGFTAVFLGAVPVTSYLTQPGGALESVVNAFVRVLLPGSAGIPTERMVPALAAIYSFVTFAATGAFSVAGVGAAYKEGSDLNHPRAQTAGLTGLPLRLRSAHYNMLENFSGFAISAALTQVLAPSNQHLINLLGLHVISKVAIHYPAYLLNIAPPRTLAHVLATSAVVNVAYKLALGAK